jgi:hypothetical protein
MTSGLDLSNLGPQDAIAALKSYPRRYAEQLEPVKDDDTVRDLAVRPGPEGRSAVDLTVDAAHQIGGLRDALGAIVLGRDAVVADELVDGSASAAPSGSAAGGDPAAAIEGAIAAMRTACTGMADAIGRVPPEDWKGTVTLASSGGQVPAFELVRAAVRAGSDRLRAVDAVLRAVRR